MTTAHPSDSSAQRAAEVDMLQRLSAQEGAHLTPGRFPLPGGSWLEIDGIDDSQQWFVEVFARMGGLKGAQLKKVATDVLKLVLIQEESSRQGISPRLTLAFASEEARHSIRGWLLEAIHSHGIETRLVSPADEIVERVTVAQSHQIMVNVDQVTDSEVP